MDTWQNAPTALLRALHAGGASSPGGVFYLVVSEATGFSAHFLPFPWFLDLLMTPCDFFFLVYVELEMDTRQNFKKTYVY